MKVGVVGFGHIGKQHCKNVMDNDELELAYICDPYIEVEDLPDGIEEGCLVKDYDSWIESLTPADLDLLIIATPNHLHYPMLVKAMTTYPFAGTPILVEKPVVIEDEHIDELHYIQDQRIDEGLGEIPIFVNYPLRFLPSVDVLKNNWNSVGDVRVANVGVFWNRNKGYYDASEWRGKLNQEGGPLFNEFIHHLDLISYLGGELEIQNGVVKDFSHDYTEVEDTGIINFGFQNGGVGVLTYTVATPEKSFDVNLHFIGTKGSAKLTGLYTNRLIINDDVYEFPVNRNHYAQVLYAIVDYLKSDDSENKKLDERICLMDEGLELVSKINQFYSISREQLHFGW